MKKLSCIALFLIFGISSLFSQSAQKKIDSLMVVAESSNDSVRLRIFNRVSFYYIFNEPVRAKKLLLKGIKASQQKNNPFSEAELTNTYGIYYDVSGNSDSAKYYFEKALDISQAHNYKTITIMVINNLGMFHWNKGNYQEALYYFFQALEMNKSEISSSSADTYYSNIGLIYQEMGLPDKALEYHNQALELRRAIGDKKNIAISLNNIGISLSQKNKYNEAEKAFNEAVKAAEEANEYGVLYNTLNGLANLHIATGAYTKAIPILQKSISERNRLNIERRANLSAIANIISAYLGSGQINKAKDYIETGNNFLVEFPDLLVSAVDFYGAASQVYFMENNYTEGMRYFEKALAAKDSIFSTENAEKTANLETKFKVSERERDLAETRANLAESELKVEQKNTFIFGMTALVLILGLLGYLLYNQQKLKNRQLKKEGELKTALAKIETQNQLQEQRLRISRDLHDNIGSQLTFIISSIDNLQYGFSEKNEKLNEKLNSISKFTGQTIFELRDTIWAMNKTDISIGDLQARIANFIEKAGIASNVNFQFHLDNSIEKEIVYNSIQGMNIYRIIQEAVNNALKYSEATAITVHFSKMLHTAKTKGKTEFIYKIEIIDNGKGFNPEKITFGNGIANMKKRTEDLRGKLEIISEKETGTTIVLKF
ncbi:MULTISPECIES: tetratricopeptide repeat-containing sensor histidine kinase [Aequorivita]|uniref:histidine kinase n=2 Tax=Aequorivita TaxID=153265 RepID=A0AB35YYQ7_9FLAO|nr:tetratricopeptide repeat protein [Aequorivita sp. Ant34-E75]WGF92890.1 tetratricopeptide repeat protein [Aequorivita sp. Ant34-E75]